MYTEHIKYYQENPAFSQVSYLCIFVLGDLKESGTEDQTQLNNHRSDVS